VAASRGFPPLQQATVVALACELPTRRAQPLSRYSTGDLARLISAHPAAPPLSRSTIWRILDRHVLNPWRYRSWLYPRDPAFAAKAGRVLDLYAGVWEGQPLGPRDYVLSADEKTSIQARGRCHPSTPPGPGAPLRVEHEYARGGALAYLAAWDVRAGGVSGRCEATTGKAAFGRLVDQVMAQEPYRSARRVFWIVDNGSSHRGTTAAADLAARHPTLIVVHLPTHASWLNQIEIYFSIVQRKVLTPNDFADLAAVEDRLRVFADLYNDTAVPFDWRFTRADLDARLADLTIVRPTEDEPIPTAA
jgi:DDE superfamily endonuclease